MSYTRRLLSMLIPCLPLILLSAQLHASYQFHDFNGDRRDDLLIQDGERYYCGLSPEPLALLELTPISNFPKTSGSHIAAQGDFNGDDSVDFLFRDEDGRWEIVSMNGCEPIEDSRESTSSIVGSQWRVVGTADMNGDNRDDLILRDDQGAWTILFMHGINVIQTIDQPEGLPADTFWYVIGIGDFNSDARVDILLKHRDGAWELKTPTNTPAESFTTLSVPFEMRQDWRDEATGDFNGDGQSDLLLRHADGSWKIQWLSKALDSSSLQLEERRVMHLPVDWQWQHVATGDLNGDTIEELVLTNESDSLDSWFRTSLHAESDGEIEPLANVLADYTIPQSPIYVPDIALRSILFSHLDLSTNTWLFASQLRTLQTLTAPDGRNLDEYERIRDLRGFRHAHRLDAFTARLHTIKFLSPIIGLNELLHLDLSSQQYEQEYDMDLSSLSGSTTLRSLYLNNNSINDISAISQLLDLRDLDLSNNKIRDIDALSNLINLYRLRLGSNQIDDLNALTGLVNLSILNLRDNNLKNISALNKLENLFSLNLGHNSINDISPLADLRNLKYLYLRSNEFVDLDALSGMTKLTFLDLRSNLIENIAPLSNLVLLENLLLEDNRIMEIAPLVSLPNLIGVTINRNPLSDDSVSEIIPVLIANGVNVDYVPILKFRSSLGRTASYVIDKYYAEESPNGVLVHFHGNVGYESIDDALRHNIHLVGGSYYAGNTALLRSDTIAEQLNLVPVMVASPFGHTSAGEFVLPNQSGDSTRAWNYNEDLDLIHEMLQTDFDGNLRVDTNRVFLWGSSQGTCFVNQFMKRWGSFYGGGVFAECGCSEGLDPLRTSNGVGGRDTRVLVKAPTGDFLHTLSVQAYGYYKYVQELETIGDLASPAGHCGRSDISKDEALTWLATGEGLTEFTEANRDEPHFSRVSLLDRVVGIGSDQDGKLWVVQQEIAGESAIASLWQSVDRGELFEFVNKIDEKIYDLDVVENALFLTTSKGEVLRSLDGGHVFTKIEIDAPNTSALLNSGSTVTFVRAYPHGLELPGLTSTASGSLLMIVRNEDSVIEDRMLVSTDLGETWQSHSVPKRQNAIRPDPVNVVGDRWHLTLSSFDTVKWIAEDFELNWKTVNPFDEYVGINSIAWEGRYLLANSVRSYSDIWQSSDLGHSWERASVPSSAVISFGRYGPATLSAVGHQEVLLLGGGRDGYLYNGNTNDWRAILGGAAIGFQRESSRTGLAFPHKVVVDPIRGDIYVTDSRGIFRIDARYRDANQEFSGFNDADADGIPDSIDRFPLESDEYLDTDGDGIGNIADNDDDGDGRLDANDAAPLDPREYEDLDYDSIGNMSDNDVDGDRIPNVLDRFNRDPYEWADTDNDGIGDWEDKDDDNDGVGDAEDRFPQYPFETGDADNDAIGDDIDPHPNQSTYDSSEYFTNARGAWSRPVHPPRVVRFTDQPTANVTYPDVTDGLVLYAQLTLGDLPNSIIELMLVTYEGIPTQLLYYDRNGDGDLTNDQSVMWLEGGLPTESWDRNWVEISYQSGVTLPYVLDVYVDSWISEEKINAQLTVYRVGKVTLYEMTDDSVVAVATIDADGDGIFNGMADYMCLDLNQNGSFDGCVSNSDSAERFNSGTVVEFADVAYQVDITPSGYRVAFQAVSNANRTLARSKERVPGNTRDTIEIRDERDVTPETFYELPFVQKEQIDEKYLPPDALGD